MAHDVFISYAKEDREVAKKVSQALEAAGYETWIAPESIPPGTEYEEAIVEAINTAPFMVLVISEHSNDSAHVRREVKRAFAEGSPTRVIPFHIENIIYSSSLSYYLESLQWLDAWTPPLEAHLQRLVEWVRDLHPLEAKRETRPSAEGFGEPRPPRTLSTASETSPNTAQTVLSGASSAAEAVGAGASVGVSSTGDGSVGAKSASKGLAMVGCGILLAVAVGLFLLGRSCASATDSTNTANSNGVVNTNAGRQVNVNQLIPNLNTNTTPTPQATPTPRATPTPQPTPTPSDSRPVEVRLRDGSIQIGIEKALSRIAGLSDVKVEVKGGEAILGGRIYSDNCRQAALKLSRAEGAKVVHDKMAMNRSLLPDKLICSGK